MLIIEWEQDHDLLELFDHTVSDHLVSHVQYGVVGIILSGQVDVTSVFIARDSLYDREL